MDPSWSGRTIELRCDPFDLSRIDVYQECRPVARAHVRNLKRSRYLELEPLVQEPTPEPSGIHFLDTLRREHRQRMLNELGEIPFRSLLTQGDSTDEEAP